MPFLRRHGFSSAYNGGAMQEKSPGVTRVGASRETPISDKDHDIDVGAIRLAGACDETFL